MTCNGVRGTGHFMQIRLFASEYSSPVSKGRRVLLSTMWVHCSRVSSLTNIFKNAARQPSHNGRLHPSTTCQSYAPPTNFETAALLCVWARQPWALPTSSMVSTQSLASSADEPLNGLIIFKTSGERVSSTKTRCTTGLGAANGFSVCSLVGRWVGVWNMGEIGVSHRRNCSLRFKRRLDDNWRPPFLLNNVFVAPFLSWFAWGKRTCRGGSGGGERDFLLHQ